MTLNIYRDEVAAFLRIVDPTSRETIGDILQLLDSEYAKFKQLIKDPDRCAGQLYDVLFLVMEAAAKLNIDLDSEWQSGRERKKKYGPMMRAPDKPPLERASQEK